MAYKAIPTGKGLNSGKTGVYNDILVEKKEYGSGRLTTLIEGPSRVIIKYIDNNDGTLKVSYKPSIPGEYSITLKLDTWYLPGCPFRVHVTGAAPSLLTRYGDGHIRTKNSHRPEMFSTSADFMWITKPGVKMSLNATEEDVDTSFGGRSTIEVARYVPVSIGSGRFMRTIG